MDEETPRRGYLTVLAKPTGRCNLRCEFCYQNANNMPRGSRMRPEVQETLVRRVCEYPATSLGLDWIGGEALLAGIDFYERCEELIAKYQRPGTIITSPIQTNGTLLNEEWIDFFKANPRYSLSIGFEVFEHLQNSLRTGYGAFADSYSIVSNNLRMLNESKIPYGVLTVIEMETLEISPKEWLEAVVAHGIRQIGLQLSYKQIYGGDLAKVQKYVDWLDGLFLEQARHNETCSPEKRLMIRESYYLYNMLRGTEVNYSCCHHSPDICSDFMLSVGEDGRVYGHCDAFMGSRGEDGEYYYVGSIMEQSFGSILQSTKLREIRRKLAIGREKCRACSYYALCQGGCGFFKGTNLGSIAMGFGDPIDSYCAIKIAQLSYITEADRAKVIAQAYRYLNDRSILPGTPMQVKAFDPTCSSP